MAIARQCRCGHPAGEHLRPSIPGRTYACLKGGRVGGCGCLKYVAIPVTSSCQLGARDDRGTWVPPEVAKGMPRWRRKEWDAENAKGILIHYVGWVRKGRPLAVTRTFATDDAGRRVANHGRWRITHRGTNRCVLPNRRIDGHLQDSDLGYLLRDAWLLAEVAEDCGFDWDLITRETVERYRPAAMEALRRAVEAMETRGRMLAALFAAPTGDWKL